MRPTPFSVPRRTYPAPRSSQGAHFELAVGLFLMTVLFERRHLRFGEDHSLLGHFRLEQAQTLLHALHVVALPHGSTPDGEISSPRFASSLATRTWPHVGCSTANSTTADSISGATLFFSRGPRRLISTAPGVGPGVSLRLRKTARGETRRRIVKVPHIEAERREDRTGDEGVQRAGGSPLRL